MKRDGISIEKINDNQLTQIFKAVDDGSLPKSSVTQTLTDMAQGTFKSFKEYAGAGDDELEVVIKELVAKHPGLAQGAYMGKIMAHFKGKADGKKVSELLK